jgi:hypothetical protein
MYQGKLEWLTVWNEESSKQCLIAVIVV